jgi:hypothetical protein
VSAVVEEPAAGNVGVARVSCEENMMNACVCEWHIRVHMVDIAPIIIASIDVFKQFFERLERHQATLSDSQPSHNNQTKPVNENGQRKLERPVEG